MKKNIIKSLCLIFAVGFLASCDKEAEITRLSVINFPQTFASSANSVVITKDNGDTEAASFNWAAVSYGIKAAVTYSLQFDLPADTLGATPWSKAQEVVVGDDMLTKTITANELNDIAINGLGLEPGVISKVVVRVKSYVDRPAYSNAITLDVTPYTSPVVVPSYPSLWIPGDYQGWNPATASTIVSVNSDKIYEGFVYFPAGGTLQYKFTAQPDWTPMAYGDGTNGVLIEANYSGGNFTAPFDGYYNLWVDLNTMQYTVLKTTWGIIGDATPNGWDTPDTKMTYDELLKAWVVTCDMKVGSFKFRANDEWKMDFGIDATGKLVYANNPHKPYIDQPAIPVASAGNYTITLDLHVPGSYTYKLKKN